MHVPLQHIIGTVALLSLVIAVTLAYSITTSYVQTDIQHQQLKQITENVALNIVEMANLDRFATYSYEPIMKTINLPTELSSKTYTIQLVDGTNEGKGYYVQASLVTNPNIIAISSIPLNSAEVPLSLHTDITTQQMQIGFDRTPITYSGTVYGKTNTVIWAKATWSGTDSTPSSIVVGLGWIRET